MQQQRPGRGAARRYVAVQVPVEHKDLAESIQSLVDATVKAASGNAGGGAVDYAAMDNGLVKATRMQLDIPAKQGQIVTETSDWIKQE